MPYSDTRAAATSSFVDSGLLAARTTSAPPALRVRIRLAVSVVTWRHAPIRIPSSGRSRSNRSRIRRRTGISRSAHSIRRMPSDARPRSVRSWAGSPAVPAVATGIVSVIVVSMLPAVEQTTERCGQVGPRRAESMGEALLEPDVLDKSEPAVGLECGRVVRANIQDDLVAGPEELLGHGAGHGGREAAAAIVDVGQDVADDRDPGVATDHV